MGRIGKRLNEQSPLGQAIVALIVVAVLTIVVLIVLGYIYQWEWVGVGEAYRPRPFDNEGTPKDIRREKTLWDWMQLLIIPVAVAIGTFVLNQMSQRREQGLEQQRSQDAALQSYLDQMSQLLIEKEGTQLRQLEPDTDVRRLMAAQTSTLMQRLDKGRTLAVVRFLAEAHLISKPNPVVSLVGADLSGIDFKGVDLNDVDLRGANLSNADLSGATAVGADLRGANLRGTLLTLAQLDEVQLDEVAGLTQDQLIRASGDPTTILPEGLERPSWWGSEESKE